PAPRAGVGLAPAPRPPRPDRTRARQRRSRASRRDAAAARAAGAPRNAPCRGEGAARRRAPSRRLRARRRHRGRVRPAYPAEARRRRHRAPVPLAAVGATPPRSWRRGAGAARWPAGEPAHGDGGDLQAPRRARDRRLPRRRRMAGQSRRLCHPGPCRPLHPPSHRLLFQCGRVAAVRDGQPPRRPRLRAGASDRAAHAVSGTLLIAASPGELWAALVAGERLRELRVFRAEAGRGRVGEVVLGRVVALKPELPGALVDIGVARPAFLSAEDATPGFAALTEGAAIIVQVTKEARADKAVGASMRLRLGGRFVDLTPGRAGVSATKAVPPAERERLLAALREIAGAGEGFVLRTAAAPTAADLAADAESLRARWRAIEAARTRAEAPASLEPPPAPLAMLLAAYAPAMPEAIVIDERAAFAEARLWLTRHSPALVERLSLHREQPPLFEHYGVAGDIAAALSPRVLLPEGGALTIELTAAATMIDVDSGGAARGRGAASAILAVPIAIDFVGMRDRRDRDRVRAELTEALADDADTEVLGWTRLGHLELVRKRRHAPLAELLFERAPGGGLVKTPLTVALEALRALAREAAAAP